MFVCGAFFLVHFYSHYHAMFFSFQVRVACTSAGGHSQYSEVCHISTEPVCPGQCAPPRVHGKPKSTTVQLKWGWPESDGGSPVMEFEIDMTTPDNETRGVYRGASTECVVASLLPGRPYLFQVRAHNKAGPGNWSESLEVVSGAGPPGQPKEPRVVCKPGGTISLASWEAPINNGALIQEFQLEIAMVRKTVVRAEVEEESEEEEDVDAAEDMDQDEVDDEDLSSSEGEEKEEEEEEYDDDSPDSDDEDASSCSPSPKRYPAAPDSRNPSSSTKRGLKSKERKHLKSEDVAEDKTVLPLVYEEDCDSMEYSSCYVGTANQFEVRSLVPATTYRFRVSALNSAGRSEWSNIVEVSYVLGY
jgi:hypothetical protein